MTADPNDTEELRERIEDTRAELGRTVEELAAKADLRARAKGAAADAREQAAARVRRAADSVRSRPGPVVVAVAAALVAFLTLRRIGRR